jgi:retron-type reverse transcriptase
LIVVRLKTALADVVGHSQTAFLPGRNISDAILLTQELMHNYHQNKGPPRCALKIDLKKAFDTVRWDYIIAGLHAISLPQELISWITTCITTVHYTININGELHGFFKATRGIRQGDPLSPYLFVLAMEGLGGIIRRSI